MSGSGVVSEIPYKWHSGSTVIGICQKAMKKEIGISQNGEPLIFGRN